MKKLFKSLALFLFFLGIMLLANSCGATTYTKSCNCKCIKYSNPNVIKDERYGYS
jgi:hypothetical protein